jgi:hypothetical protein
MKQLSITMALAVLLVGHAAGQAWTQWTPADQHKLQEMLAGMKLPKTCFTRGMGSVAARRTFIDSIKTGMLGPNVLINESMVGVNWDIFLVNVPNNGTPAAAAGARIRASVLTMRTDLCQSGFSSIVFFTDNVRDFKGGFHGDVSDARVYWVGRVLPQGIQFTDKDVLNEKLLQNEASAEALKAADVWTLVP